MNRMYYTLKDWFDDTFGRNIDPESIIAKMEEEMGELISAVRTHENFKTRETSMAVQEEIADLTMAIIHLAQRHGICYNSFMDAIVTKHNVNRKRTWIEQPDGSFKHLSDDFQVVNPPKSHIGNNYQNPHRIIK